MKHSFGYFKPFFVFQILYFNQYLYLLFLLSRPTVQNSPNDPFKVILRIIPSDPSCTDGNAWFLTILLKVLFELDFMEYFWFWNLRVFNSCCFSAKVPCTLFCRTPYIGIIGIILEKRKYLPFRWSDRCFKSTVVIRTLPFACKGQLGFGFQSL